jgi:hypothetical protein
VAVGDEGMMAGCREEQPRLAAAGRAQLIQL